MDEFLVYLGGVVGAMVPLLLTLRKWTTLSAWEKAWITVGVIVPAIVLTIQFRSQVLQKTASQKRAERTLAIILAAYEGHHIELLQPMATGEMRYLLGYRQFRNSEWATAKDHFRELIDQHLYEAPSRYLLAFMATHSTDRMFVKQADVKGAFAELRKSLEYDKDYVPSRYLQGMLRLNYGQAAEGLKDIEEAVRSFPLGAATCKSLMVEMDICSRSNSAFPRGGSAQVDGEVKAALKNAAQTCQKTHQLSCPQ